MHSRNVESEGCHFMFYGVVGMEVDCRVGSGWFSVYVCFEVCVILCYFQVKEVYGVVGFMCGVKFYLVMNLIYVCVLMVWGWIFVMSYMIKISSTYLMYSAMFFVSPSCFMCRSS